MWPTSGCSPSDGQHDTALGAQQRPQPLLVGGGDGLKLVVALEQVADGALGKGDPAAREFAMDLLCQRRCHEVREIAWRPQQSLDVTYCSNRQTITRLGTPWDAWIRLSVAALLSNLGDFRRIRRGVEFHTSYQQRAFYAPPQASLWCVPISSAFVFLHKRRTGPRSARHLRIGMERALDSGPVRECRLHRTVPDS